jgi:NTE family protein
VLAVLEENRIPVRAVVGSSAGAVVGAMWLAFGGAETAIARWREFLASGVPDSLPDVRLTDEVTSRDNLILQFARRLRRGALLLLALERHALVETGSLERALAILVPDLRVEDLPGSFAAVATDEATGSAATLTEGKLRAVLAASCAVPGMVPPYRIGSRVFFDGGVVADVPVREAREFGGSPVVAVDVGEALPATDGTSLTVPRALLRAGIMTHAALRAEICREADLVLRPAVGSIHWSEFRHLDDAVAAGRAAAERSLLRLAALATRRRAPTPAGPRDRA